MFPQVTTCEVSLTLMVIGISKSTTQLKRDKTNVIGDVSTITQVELGRKKNVNAGGSIHKQP